jgi:hypothetical protein
MLNILALALWGFLKEDLLNFTIYIKGKTMTPWGRATFNPRLLFEQTWYTH